MGATLITSFKDFAAQGATAFAASALILLYWAWALAGRRAFLRNGIGHLIGRRQRAASGPLLLLAGLALLGHTVAGRLALELTNGAGATAVFVYFVARDPFRQGFWHHRRLRSLVSLLLIAAGLVGAYTSPWPELVPVVVATMLFHRHMNLTTSLIAAQLEDLDAVRSKLVTLESREMIARAVTSVQAPGSSPDVQGFTNTTSTTDTTVPAPLRRAG